MFTSLLLLSLQSSPADVAAARAELLIGVHSLEAVGVPGPVIVFGPEAFAVLTDDRGVAVVGAARHGSGRVVAFGHGGYVGDAPQGSERERILANAIAWCATSKGEPVVRELDPRAEADDWKGVDVLRWSGGNLGEELQGSLREFVFAGGGLVVGQCPWGWQQLNPDASLREDAPVNRVVAPMGLAFGPTTLSGPFVKTASRPKEAHAGQALEALLGGEGEPVLHALERALQAVPRADTLFLPRLVAHLEQDVDFRVPSATAPVERADVSSRMQLAWWTRRFEEAPPDASLVAPGVEHFPGAVAESVPRTAGTVEIEGTPSGWVSTGLYAAPGEAVTIQVLSGDVRGWAVRIGAHTDSIQRHDRWKRWPRITRRLDLDGATSTVASPFGGLLYVEAGRGAVGPLALGFRGVIDAPFFSLRETSRIDWKVEREDPAPWAEIAGEHLILTVPSVAIRELEDPEDLAKFWDDVMRAHCRLGARPLPRRPERFVADVQISAGYMHSGYPIMTHLDVTEPSDGRPLGVTVDTNRLRSHGSWGHFHELGHNCQRTWWTFAGTGEVTCNLFALHAMDQVVGLEPWNVDWLEKQKDKARAYFEAGAPFDQWKRKAGLALLMYAQIQRAFGWDPFYTVFAQYEALPKGERPSTDDQKRDQWMVRMSRAVGHDLGPFFERWGVPVSRAARRQSASLPGWMPDFAELDE